MVGKTAVAKRQLVLERALLDAVQDADREQRMLVDGIDVIHVVLHLGDDAAEIGYETAEHAGLVHPAQCGLGIFFGREYLDEQPVGLRVVAQIGVDELQRLGDDSERVRMDVEPFLLRDMKEPDERDRIVAELAVARHVEPAGIDREPFDRLLAPAPALERKARLAAVLGFELRAEDAGQIADILRDQEIVLHEALDAARASVVGIAHQPPDLALAIKGQPVLGATGEEVQMAPHRPQEILRPREALRLLGREHLQTDELVDVVDAVDVFRDPEQGMEIAQAALALLDVGLDEVARIAQPLVAGIALGELRLDEFG